MLVPRDEEQDGLLGAQDDAGLGGDPVAGDDEVDALARPDLERPVVAEHRLDLVGPDPGGGDDPAGADVELLAGAVVAGPDPDDALAVVRAEHAHGRDAVDDVGAVHGRGPGQLEDEAGVVDLGVVVLDRAGEGVGAQARHEPQGGLLAEVAVAGEAGGLAHAERQPVVERDARSRRRSAPTRACSAGT